MLDVTKCVRSVQYPRGTIRKCDSCAHSVRRPSAYFFFFLRTIDRSLPTIHLTFLAMLLVHFYSRPIFSNEQDKKPNTASIVTSRYHPYKSFNTQTRTFEGTILSFCSFDAFAWSFACDKVHQRVTIGCVLAGRNKKLRVDRRSRQSRKLENQKYPNVH